MALQEETDQFDCLPDAMLHLIFSKLHDAQSLTRSMSVCKRFASVIPEVDTVSFTIPRKITLKQQQYNAQITKSNCTGCGREGSKSLFKSLIRKVISIPIRFLLHRVFSSKFSRLDKEDTDRYFYPPDEVLKNFKEIQSLRIELPGDGGDIGSDGCDSLLRWRAEFGSEIENCVIFGAKSLHKSSKNHNNGEEIDEQLRQRSEEELLISDDELKMRIVWTISCLISASARHYLLQKVVSKHPKLRSVVIGDGSKQGRFCMRREQIENFRKNINLAANVNLSSDMERTTVPALKMKLWYVPELELPAAGCVMKGATLLVIRPVDGEEEEERECDLVSRVWNVNNDDDKEEVEELYGEAVGEIMKKKESYTLEMNSF